LQEPAAKFTATRSTIYLDLDPDTKAPIKKQEQEKPPSDKAETLDMGTQVNCIQSYKAHLLKSKRPNYQQ